MTTGEQASPIPPAVTEAVHSRGLGELVSTRYLKHPAVTATASFIIAAICIGVLFGASAIGAHTDGFLRSFIRLFALAGCFGTVAALGYGIAAVARGAQTFYIFSNGMLRLRNGKVRAYTWGELAELRAVIGTKGDAAGKLLHYRLVPRNGPAIAIPLVLVDGRDEFIDNLIAAMQYHGLPVN